MRSSPLNRLRHFRYRAFLAATVVLLAAFSFTAFRVDLLDMRPKSLTGIRHHGPWVFGYPHAQFTIVEYSDLECPYCRAYFPVLRHWIREHPQVNWEWRSLPLAIHDPAASHEALLAECIGEVAGDLAFWRAVAWIYTHTRGEGLGLSSDAGIPGISPAARACSRAAEAAEVLRAQLAEAAGKEIFATPTLRLIDRKTGRSLVFEGPVEGDLLLSGLGLLASKEDRRPSDQATYVIKERSNSLDSADRAHPLR